MIERLERTITRLVSMVVSVGVLFVGSKFFVDDDETLVGSGVILLAVLVFLYGITRK